MIIYYCVACQHEGATVRLDRPVDHWKPKGVGGSDDPENRIPLCNKHHRKKHDDPKWAKSLGLKLSRYDEERPWWETFPKAIYKGDLTGKALSDRIREDLT